MPSTLSPFQLHAIRTSLQDYGELPLAAHQAGITLSVLKREIAKDEDFAEEVEHLLALHGSAMVVLAQSKARTSDMILKTLLEAKVPGFSRETRDRKSDTGKPTVLTLRSFDDDGNEAAEEVKPKEPQGPFLLTMAQML